MTGAGEMRNYGSIQRAGRSRAGSSEQPNWADLYKVCAKISATGGREFQSARAEQPELTHEITIPYRREPRIQPADRFLFGDRIFDIKTVIDQDELHEEYTMHCVERLRPIA